MGIAYFYDWVHINDTIFSTLLDQQILQDVYGSLECWNLNINEVMTLVALSTKFLWLSTQKR
jgi:hypothetical protein